MVAIAVLAVLIAVTQPVSATVIAPEINQGATVYIGEEGLDITHALNQAHGQSGDLSAVPGNTRIGWWAAAMIITTTSPIRTIELNGSYRSFNASSGSFVGYTGNWFLIDNATNMADLTNGGAPRAVFIVADPFLDVSVWDFDQSLDVSGRSVPSGERLGFRIKTNLYSALDDRYRSPVTHTDTDGYIDITVKDSQGTTLTSLTTGPGVTTPLTQQAARTYTSLWPSADGSLSWQTDAKDGGGADLYPAGTYMIGAVSVLNNMRENYKNAGADYTGKTVSQTYTVTLVPDTVTIEANKDPTVRGNRFSVTIRGKPSTTYYLWVKDEGPPPYPITILQDPPSILLSAPVIQDPPSGPYTIGNHLVLDGNGKTVMESVPLSVHDTTQHYAAVRTSNRGTATVEIQTWNVTGEGSRPADFTFHVEDGSVSDEVSFGVWGGIPPVSPNGIDPAKVIQDPRINQEFPDTGQTSDFEVIVQGATVFIGEGSLNVTAALNQAQGNSALPFANPVKTKIGWWAYASGVPSTGPVRTVDLGTRHTSLTVEPADFVGYTGNWYLVDTDTGMADLSNGGVPQIVFTVQDPALEIRVWDLDLKADVSGTSVPQGQRLTFMIDSNLYPVTYQGKRPHVSDSTPGFITIRVRNENKAIYNYLYQDNATTIDLTNQFVNTQPFSWGTDTRHNLHNTPQTRAYWGTDLRDSDYNFFYPAGTYVVWAESTLNTMKENYRCAGVDYTGKTISQTKTVTLVLPALNLEANRDSVVRSNRFSLTICGKPSTQYNLWVRDDGDAPLPVNEVPPSILPSSKVIQDPVTGPYPVGAFTLMSGRSLRESVPPSLLDPSLHYAAVMTDKNGQATVEIQTWNATRPATYTFCVEGESRSGEVAVSVTGGNIPVSPAGIDPAKVIQNPRTNQEFPDTGQTSDYEVVVQGATIFIGEGGLNVTAALNQAQGNSAVPYADPVKTKIGWWASAGLVPHTGPIRTVDLGARHTSLTVGPADFVGYTGNWYLVDPDSGMADLSNGGVPQVVFNVQDPELDIKIWDLDQGINSWGLDVSGKSVPQGTRLTFLIDTNMYPVTYKSYRPQVSDSTPGFITIRVKNENGATYNFLYQNNTTAYDLTNQFVDVQPFVWNEDYRHNLHNTHSTRVYWGTDLRDSDYNFFYPAGTYVVYAESTLNQMRNNYKNAGADYTGKTISQYKTITLVPDVTRLEATKNTVVRGSPFSVTVTGKPKTLYYLWVSGTGAMTGAGGAQPPQIENNQESVYFDTPSLDNTPAGPVNRPIGIYRYRNGNGRTIKDDVATDTGTDAPDYNGTRYYSAIITTTSGTRTIGFTTNGQTRAQKYTIRIENRTGQAGSYTYRSDEIDLVVVKPTLPTIKTVTPASAFLNTTVDFTITGTDFDPSPRNTWVNFTRSTGGGHFDNLNVTLTSVTNQEIQGKMAIGADAPTGSWSLTVSTAGMGTSLPKAGAITVADNTAPSITSITPVQGALNTTVNVVIRGNNFQAGESRTRVRVYEDVMDTELGSTIMTITPTMIAGNITIPPDAIPGSYILEVYTVDGGTATRPAAFSAGHPAIPTITGITPNSGFRNSTIQCIIKGKDFQPGLTQVMFRNQSTNAVIGTFGIVDVTSTAINGNFAIPANAPTGLYRIDVITVDGGAAHRTGVFRVNEPGTPAITSITPTTGAKGSVVAFTIRGSNFQGGDRTTVQIYDTVSGTWLSTTLYQVTETTIIGSVTIPDSAPAGKYTLEVRTADGGTVSRYEAFTVNYRGLPLISSITPAAGKRGTDVNFTLKGSNFVDGGTIVRLRIPGSTINSTVLNANATMVLGSFPIPAGATTGSYRLDVFTQGGGINSKLNGFAVTA